ncbi:MAG: carboxypeptidase-like regulatory domain-containing protein [Psychroserpens sp.]|nr:carboxypeptidase-like regulatory domain-containing protein [Psychroserpens sp.]
MKNLFILILLLGFECYPQSKQSYTIIDYDTKEPVAFANIVFNDEIYSGTISDIDGVFYISDTVKKLSISYVGYESKSIEVSSLNSTIISLKKEISTLDEVVITNSENPAHRIIRNAIKNKELNNPENLNSFTYRSYDKIIVDGEDMKAKEDSLNELGNFFEKSYLFITETVAKRKYLKPKFTEDSIIAVRTSGFKSPNFAFLANSIQPFSFYDEYITLFETDYLNPISKGSTKKYKFRLKEEYLRGKDTIFAISFEPNTNRNFEGLKGLVYINSNGYAVQSVDATTFNSGKIEVSIQQKYKFINEKHWFPEQLNFQIGIGETYGRLKYVGKSYLSEVKLNTNLTKKDFPVLPTGVQKEAVKKDVEFWNAIRQDSLTQKETRTYVVIDSIGEKLKFDKLLTYSAKLSKGLFPLKYFDVDLTKIVSYNKYEGIRLGAGMYTNENVFKNVSIGGFAGYGFQDYEWKYGGELLIDVPSKKDIKVQLKYEHNLKETGSSYFNHNQPLFNPRYVLAEQMDQIEAFSFKTKMKLFRNIDWSVGFNTADIKPLYDYSFNAGGESIINYTNSEINLGISYFVNEKLNNIFNTLTRTIGDDPVFNLNYSRGLSTIFGGDFSYNKIRFTLDHSFKTKGLGKTTYRLDMGYIDNAIPYGQLFTGEGSYDKVFPYVFHNYFQTTEPYEFLSDKYLSLFTYHNFGMLLNNKGFFTPEVVLHNNFGIGNLSNAAYHENIAFNIKNELFLETGLELRNILKINYLDVGYLGLGAGGFYRYGYHSLPDSGDNFVFKFAAGFTFK